MGAGEAIYARLRSTLTPGVRNSQVSYAKRLRELTAAAPRWLDIGCGHNILPDWLDDREPFPVTPVGVDADPAALRAHPTLRHRILANVEALPFIARRFDLVTANMVVEHVERPADLFRELGRVLAPGGRILLHTPNAEGYTTRLTQLSPPSMRPLLASMLHGRATEDVYPTFYRANTREALIGLARDAGLRVVSLEYVLSSPQLMRIPPLLVAEMLWIRRITAAAHERHRPVLLVTLGHRE